MKLIHVNPATGDTGVCRAVKDQCPFGAENHFGSVTEARQSFELRQQAPAVLQKSLDTVALSKVVDPELLRKMISQGYIMQGLHPDDSDLRILCYGTRTQIEGKWNEATKVARGLIIRTDSDDLANAVVVQRPWEKFFTLSQLEGSWHLGDEENESSAEDSFGKLDFKAPAEVYDKMDGSLGILYRDPKGLPTLATKGAFISEQAKMFTKLLRSDKATSEAAEEILEQGDTTAMFELVGPKNRIVLAYKKNEIVLLGGVKKASGANVEPEALSAWSKSLPTVERMKAKTLEEALAIAPRENREGVVVSVGGKTPMKIKIKQADYIRIHRIVTMFSPKESRAVIMEMEASYADLVALARDEKVERFEPIKQVLDIDGFSRGDDTYEFIRSNREAYFKAILLPKARSVAKAYDVIESLDQSFFEGENPSKRFAASVHTLDADKSTLFALYRAKLDGFPLAEVNAFQELRRAIKDVKTKDD